MQFCLCPLSLCAGVSLPPGVLILCHLCPFDVLMFASVYAFSACAIHSYVICVGCLCVFLAGAQLPFCICVVKEFDEGFKELPENPSTTSGENT